MIGDYSLPKLTYDYNDLEPHMSEEQLKIHHTKHHQAYVDGANAALEKLKKARKESVELDMKAWLKSFSFMIGGHVLHSLFWKNLSPKGGGEPTGAIAKAIEGDFGSFEQFKKEFSAAAMSVEGSGWACLVRDQMGKRLHIMQIEKHNCNICPTHEILLVLDFWEHAFYIDHKNAKAGFVDAFWEMVDWDEVEKRLQQGCL
jgi:Fe-Mn family superoxide dismutase